MRRVNALLCALCVSVCVCVCVCVCERVCVYDGCVCVCERESVCLLCVMGGSELDALLGVGVNVLCAVMGCR